MIWGPLQTVTSVHFETFWDWSIMKSSNITLATTAKNGIKIATNCYFESYLQIAFSQGDKSWNLIAWHQKTKKLKKNTTTFSILWKKLLKSKSSFSFHINNLEYCASRVHGKWKKSLKSVIYFIGTIWRFLTQPLLRLFVATKLLLWTPQENDLNYSEVKQNGGHLQTYFCFFGYFLLSTKPIHPTLIYTQCWTNPTQFGIAYSGKIIHVCIANWMRQLLRTPWSFV